MDEFERSSAAWDAMWERAQNMRVAAEIEGGFPGPSDEDLIVLNAGVALGIASAAEHYRLNPKDVPTV